MYLTLTNFFKKIRIHKSNTPLIVFHSALIAKNPYFLTLQSVLKLSINLANIAKKLKIEMNEHAAIYTIFKSKN